MDKNKRIYTSYYAISGENKNAIGISNTHPDFFKGAVLSRLAPPWQLVVSRREGRIDDEEFAAKYLECLDEDRGLNAESIYNLIPDEAVLLCYEKSGDFCHRRVLADFLESHLNIQVKEIAKDSEDPKTHKTDLFEY